MAKKLKEQKNKHYRYCLDETLEEYYMRVFKINMGIYDQITIRKGRYLLPEEKGSIFNNIFDEEESETGVYKGNCYISEYKEGMVDQKN